MNDYYTDKGWTILRYWEHEIRKDFSRVMEEIILTINSLRKEDT
ncbi:DUF559 domain-containing protein [Metabacillus indicus]|nr:DUF559 domain-containing protein [Metabacillus indicus]MDX8289127.1 DUF559 domain-containing protein [Metabacillus indicus]